MTDVKIGISADVGGIRQAGKEFDNLGKTTDKLNKRKINVIDEKAIDAALKRVEKRFEEFYRNIDRASRRAGGGHGSGGGGGGAGASVPAIIPPPPPPSTSRGRLYRYTNAPEIYDVGRSFMGGFGGGFGQVASYAIRGAHAGYRDGVQGGGGGFFSGLGGMMRGAGIGALAFGAYKLGSSATEGYELAKERALTLDTLKRQMGDLGTSFAALKVIANESARGFGVNSKEVAELTLEFNRLSKGVDRSEESLSDGVRVSVGTSRAYGLDPSAGTRFFGGMRGIDPRQNTRELALLLGETINKSGMFARVDEVMQIIQSFASTTARLSLTSPNVAAFGGGFASLMKAGYSGMTPDVAASILAQANSSISGMGSAGEAGQNFILAAMQRGGGINPIMARALAEGGMFGTRRGVFGSGPLAAYFGSDAASLAGGAGSDIMTFDAIKQHLDRQGLDKSLKLDAFKNLTGVSSLANAAALYMMDSSQLGGLQKALSAAGVDINSFNERGIAGLSRIGGASSQAELSAIADEYVRRTGNGALSSSEKETLLQAKGAGQEEFRKALIKIAATKDQEETDASKMRDAVSSLEDVMIDVGDKLLAPMVAAKDALLFMAGGGRKSQRQVIGDIAQLEFDDKANPLLSQKAEIAKRMENAKRRLSNMSINDKYSFGLLSPDPALKASLEAQLKADEGAMLGIDEQLKQLEGERQQRIDATGTNSGSRRDKIGALEKKYGLPAGMLLGVWGAESSFGANPRAFAENSAGAMGHFQFLAGTAKQYGVTRGDFDSEAEGAARYLADLKRRTGSDREALARYNGAVTQSKKDEYIAKVQDQGGFMLDDVPSQLPSNASSGSGRPGEQVVHITIDGELKGREHNATFSAKTAVPLPRGAGAMVANR